MKKIIKSIFCKEAFFLIFFFFPNLFLVRANETDQEVYQELIKSPSLNTELVLYVFTNPQYQDKVFEFIQNKISAHEPEESNWQLHKLIWSYVKGIEISNTNFNEILLDLISHLKASKNNNDKILSHILKTKLNNYSFTNHIKEIESSLNKSNLKEIWEDMSQSSLAYLVQFNKNIKIPQPHYITLDFVLNVFKKWAHVLSDEKLFKNHTLLRMLFNTELPSIRLALIETLIKEKKVVLPYEHLNKMGSLFERMEWHAYRGYLAGRCSGSHYRGGPVLLKTTSLNNSKWGHTCNYSGGDSTATSAHGRMRLVSSDDLHSYLYRTVTGVFIRGGFADRGDENQTGEVSFNISGFTTIKACNNINKCSPFIEVLRENSNDISYDIGYGPLHLLGSRSISVQLNGRSLKEGESLIVDRSSKDVKIEIKFSQFFRHIGACCYISHRQYKAGVRVFRAHLKNDSDHDNSEGLLFSDRALVHFLEKKFSLDYDISEHLISLVEREEMLPNIRLSNTLSTLLLFHDYVEKSQNGSPNKKTLIGLYKQYLSNKIRNSLIPNIKNRLQEQKRFLAFFPTQTLSNLILKSIKEDVLGSQNFKMSSESLKEFHVLFGSLAHLSESQYIQESFQQVYDELQKSEKDFNQLKLINLILQFENEILYFSDLLKKEIDITVQLIAQIEGS